MAENTPDDIFQEANASFRQANEIIASEPEKANQLYQRALHRYQKLVTNGITNGRLYYNIGNTHYLLADPGRALVNYRRAEQYIPDDPNLQHNIATIVASRPDTIEATEEQAIKKILFAWHYGLPISTRSILFIVFYTGFWVCAASFLFRHDRRQRLTMIGFLTGATLFAGSLIADALAHQHLRPGVIVAQETIARKGDAQSYEPSFTSALHAATEFNLLEERGPWRHIELADGRRCWLKKKDTELIGDL